MFLVRFFSAQKCKTPIALSGVVSFEIFGLGLRKHFFCLEQCATFEPTNQPTKLPNKQPNDQQITSQKTKQPNIQPTNKTNSTNHTKPKQIKPSQTKTKKERNKPNKSTTQQTNQPTNQPIHPAKQTDSQTNKTKHDRAFLICRRARRQRSQSPILVTVRIDKHFKLYIDWSLSGKSKSSQLASHVMESTSRFLLIAQSAIRKAATLQSSYSRTATTHDCKNMQMKSQHWVAPNCTCRRAFNGKQPQCSNCIILTS